MFPFFLRSGLFTLHVCPSEILIVLHVPVPAFNNSVFSEGIIIRACWWCIGDVYLVLPAVQSFRFQLISFFSLLQHISAHLQCCLWAVSWWQQHLRAVAHPEWPCNWHLWTMLLYLKVASRAMQLQNESSHSPVPSSSLCMSFFCPPASFSMRCSILVLLLKGSYWI